ncbi:hypothetical protein LUX57_52580 [Actinomadura madurae]|uniref:hypothetical protein n=1 Tax=Actinomadura madurae TaxID=1993 RepID=UPI0020D22DF4|nr:hypothetical protein [Actinomadura madurae]MCP9972657.1 hypothetical protein [Actinomadura madurae]
MGVTAWRRPAPHGDRGRARRVRRPPGRRHVAAAVGLDHQDQVRVATALSEAGRQLYASAGRVSVAFRLDDGGRPGL